MNIKLRNLVAATLAGSALMGFGTIAKADATFDLVNALVAKGVLTEEEALPLLKGREADIATADKKVAKKAKLGISDVLDSAKLYGDIRARYEIRKGEDTAGFSEDRNRARYKLIFGVTTEADDFYTDLAFAMGSGGRSDNATFGAGNNGSNSKDALFVKRAMIGWKATDWLTLEAGRIANPLYTTPMVWDGDLTMEGLVEKVNFKVGDVDVFGNFVQSQYVGDYQNFSGPGATPTTNSRASNKLLAFQGGAKFNISNEVAAKAALTLTQYTKDTATGVATGISGAFVPGLGTATGIINNFGTNVQNTNNLKTIEIPAEISYKMANDIGLKLFSDYVYNLDGSDRYDAAVAGGATAAVRTAIREAGNDDKAWLLGIGAELKQGKSAQKGDWSARLWYQDVGVYAIDPNAVDSDFMDSRVNMKGIVFKGEYALRDNVFLNFAAGHASRKNDALAAVGVTSSDVRLNLDSYNLYQFDMTYKF